jgi:SAM-dependent methyltransferase
MEQCLVTQNIQSRLVACNVCGKSDAKPLFAATDRLHGFEGTFHYVQCNGCGMVYMNPQIAAEQLSAFYPADYAPHQAAAETLNTKKEKLSLPEHILNALNAQSKVLDVGCGSGGFLDQLRQSRHCQVFGVDFSENAVMAAKKQYGIEVFCGQISDVPPEYNRFDLITILSCIEHLTDPAAAIREIASLCKPSGMLFIKTPNYNSFAAKWFRDKWYHLDCPRHLYLFSPGTITTLLERCGFCDIRIAYGLSSKGWRGSLQYLFYGDNYRPEVKNKIRHSILAQAIISPLSHLSALLNRADTITITARKKDQ